MPYCPRWVSPKGKRIWRRLAPELFACGVLTVIDGELLALLIQAMVDYQEARAHLSKEGRVVLSPTGYPMQSPWEAMKNKALEQVHKLGAEFGLSPSSRTKLVAIDLEDDPLAELLSMGVSFDDGQN